MIDTIKNYFFDNDYYIILLDDGIYIKNYNKIISSLNNEIIININNKIYKIKGNKIKIKRCIDHDIEFSGTIESINII